MPRMEQELPSPLHAYMVPPAKTAVVCVPVELRKLLPPSKLKHILLNHIVTENQVMSAHSLGFQSTMGSPKCLSIRVVSVESDVCGTDQTMTLYKICRRTQIIIDSEWNGFYEIIPKGITSTAYSDTHAIIKGLIGNLANNDSTTGNRAITSFRSMTSVLLVGEGGSAKSQIVEEEARSASVSFLKLVPSSLAYLESASIVQALNSVFVSAFLRQPCVILLESLEQLKDSSSVTEVNHIVKRLILFLGKLNDQLQVVATRRSVLQSAPRPILVIGCTESVQNLDTSLLKAFDETINLSTATSSRVSSFVADDKEMSSGMGRCSVMDMVYKSGESHLSMSDSRMKYPDSGHSTYVLSHDDILAAVQDILLIPRRFPSVFRMYNIAPPTGILLYGPSGTGKTMLVKSLVEQAPGTFINIKISDVMSGSIGEASSVIRNLFLEAKKRSPAVIFIDEFQALFTSRDENTRSDSGDSTLIFTLIGCLDDLSSWNSCSGPEFIVTVMAATNEPWAVDEILLRTGRFDKVVFVGPMSPRSRGEILKRLMVGIENAIPMDINENNIISKTERFTGADMNILFRKACSYYSDQNWITDASSVPVFNNTYFDRVLNEMESSCSIEEFAEYVKWGREFQSKIW